MISVGSTGQVLALDSGKVAELLQVFKSNQAKYQVNVEQYCRFGDLPIMEFTEYQLGIWNFGLKYDVGLFLHHACD